MKEPDVKRLYDKIEELRQEVEKINHIQFDYTYIREQQAFLKGKCQAYEEFLIKNNLIRDPKESIINLDTIMKGTK